MPISDQIYSSFAALVGRPNSRGWRPGVYIFTHKPTGEKYLVQATIFLEDWINISLLSILIKKNSSDYCANKITWGGKLLPLIEKEGFANFSLEICVMSEELSFNSYSFFFFRAVSSST